jgi:hypothetical protein
VFGQFALDERNKFIGWQRVQFDAAFEQKPHLIVGRTVCLKILSARYA